jgi:hypothetical protein
VNVKGEPFVQILLGERIAGQLMPETAREHGRGCIEAAEASEMDAFLLTWLQTKLGLDFNDAGRVLIDGHARLPGEDHRQAAGAYEGL